MNSDESVRCEKLKLDIENFSIVGQVYFPPRMRGRQPALCFCHGIPATNPVTPKPGYPELAQRFALEGFVTCVFNFRGTGESGGNLDLLGWTRDLEVVIGHLTQLQCVDESRIFLMGFSGGAAASIYVTAHNERIAALVSCASPAEFSILRLDMLLEQCREIGTIRDQGFPPSLDEWYQHFLEVNPIRWIDKISPRPVLILHGDHDELIDVSHAHSLYDRAGEPKQLVVIPGGEHRLRTNEMAINAALPG
jgi:dipeptidyl aminopeptidase/acylaminoacyl peptidase